MGTFGVWADVDLLCHRVPLRLLFVSVNVEEEPSRDGEVLTFLVLSMSLSGNVCPLCDKCYDDDDDGDSKRMQCGRCSRWVHAKCENLTGQWLLGVGAPRPRGRRRSVVLTCLSPR